MKKELILLCIIFTPVFLVANKDITEKDHIGDIAFDCCQSETQEELNKCLEKFRKLREQAQTDKQAMKEYYQKIMERKLKKQEEEYERELQEKEREIKKERKKKIKAKEREIGVKLLSSAGAGGTAGGAAYFGLALAGGPATAIGVGTFGASLLAWEFLFPYE